jgi:CubicO group peptidase (beta-lactamase class C family)
MTTGPATDWQTNLAAWFDERTRTHEFSGHAIAWRDGAPIFSYVGGLAHRGHGVPVQEGTRFAVASVTKMATAIAALRLAERGALALDTPLLDVLPAEQRPTALTRAHTLHHLLSHTSGLADYFDDDDPNPGAFAAVWDRLPTYHARRPADILPLFVDLPAVAPPGAEVRYNNGAFVLAGLVIEAVAGRPWDAVVADEVFRPAGMVDTGTEPLDGSGPAHDRRLRRTRTGRRGLYLQRHRNPMPDGGMIPTPIDLARLIDARVGGRLTRPGFSPHDPRRPAVERAAVGLAEPRGGRDRGRAGARRRGRAWLPRRTPGRGDDVVALCSRIAGVGRSLPDRRRPWREQPRETPLMEPTGPRPVDGWFRDRSTDDATARRVRVVALSDRTSAAGAGRAAAEVRRVPHRDARDERAAAVKIASVRMDSWFAGARQATSPDVRETPGPVRIVATAAAYAVFAIVVAWVLLRLTRGPGFSVAPWFWAVDVAASIALGSIVALRAPERYTAALYAGAPIAVAGVMVLTGA